MKMQLLFFQHIHFSYLFFFFFGFFKLLFISCSIQSTFENKTVNRSS
uniref:Uncharacterized protein n=1 Tax=Anguilla anguilla TaxID=7936 RepID=A0A0E9SLE3_ANGAN